MSQAPVSRGWRRDRRPEPPSSSMPCVDRVASARNRRHRWTWFGPVGHRRSFHREAGPPAAGRPRADPPPRSDRQGRPGLRAPDSAAPAPAVPDRRDSGDGLERPPPPRELGGRARTSGVALPPTRHSRRRAGPTGRSVDRRHATPASSSRARSRTARLRPAPTVADPLHKDGTTRPSHGPSPPARAAVSPSFAGAPSAYAPAVQVYRWRIGGRPCGARFVGRRGSWGIRSPG